MPHKELSLEDAAEFLHLTPSDIRGLVQRGEIPFERKGDRTIFRKRALEGWASARLLGLNERQLDEYHKTTSAKVYDLSDSHAIVPDLMSVKGIEPALEARTKASVLRQMVKLADSTGLVNYVDDLLDGLIEREQLSSTALAGGIALLHPQHHEPYMFEDSFIVLGKSIQPIPFGSPDGATTDLFFLVCCQEERLHLHVLARLCMLCHQTSVLLHLGETDDGAGMYRALVKAEEHVIRCL